MNYQAPKFTDWVEVELRPNASLLKIDPVVACVWTGDKYPSHYVEKLKAACDKHMRIDYDFVCMTNHGDPNGWTRSGINLIDPHPELMKRCHHHEKGWWNKLRFFDENLWRHGQRILMVDLDAVIVGDLTDFFRADHHTTAIANFGVNYRHSKYNSSMVLWDPHGPAARCWAQFEADDFEAIRHLHGDQCYFWRIMVDDVKTWDRDWAISYKYQAKPKGLPGDCRAVIFHGKPDPHEVRDTWAKQNWHDL